LPQLVCWPVDALAKVFREDEPGREGKVLIESARNEFESGQIAVQSEKDAELQLTCTPLKHKSKDERLQCMPRFVGYVKVKENVIVDAKFKTSGAEQLLPQALWLLNWLRERLLKKH